MLVCVKNVLWLLLLLATPTIVHRRKYRQHGHSVSDLLQTTPNIAQQEAIKVEKSTLEQIWRFLVFNLLGKKNWIFSSSLFRNETGGRFLEKIDQLIFYWYFCWSLIAFLLSRSGMRLPFKTIKSKNPCLTSFNADIAKHEPLFFVHSTSGIWMLC